jgi:aspartate beta-hydroxylase
MAMNEPIPAPQMVAQQANAEGVAAIRAGDPAAAIAALSRATAADPDALPLWRNLAHAHQLGGNAEGERAAIDRLDFGSQLRMAQLLQRIGEETRALVAWHGVQQLAAQQAEPFVPQIQAQLDEGAAYCRALQDRLGTQADQLLDEGQSRWDETEQRRIKAFVERALGRRAIFTNECMGLHYPFLPADEFFDRKHFPWFDELESHTAAIRTELLGIIDDPGDAIRPYVRIEEGSPDSKWSKLDHSLDWGACFLWEHGQANLPVHERCPRTAAVLASLPMLRIPGRGPAAFFSILRPGSHIPPHTGVTNTRAIIHLPLIVPPGCGFRVGGETRQWVEGQAFAFDDTIEHEAWNNSDQRRAVLIIDAWNPHLALAEREAVSAYIERSDAVLA